RDRQMENKPAQNIQDSFLNTARKDKTQITIYLLSGVKLSGRIRSFDKYSVVLETNNQEQLIFKHAISTVVMSKGSHHVETRSHRPAEGGEVISVKWGGLFFPGKVPRRIRSANGMILTHRHRLERAFLVAVEFRRRSSKDKDLEVPPSAVVARNVATDGERR